MYITSIFDIYLRPQWKGGQFSDRYIEENKWNLIKWKKKITINLKYLPLNEYQVN